MSKKDKKFTVLGLTTFSGDPVMCVVIIDGKTRDVFMELGIDPSAAANPMPPIELPSDTNQQPPTNELPSDATTNNRQPPSETSTNNKLPSDTVFDDILNNIGEGKVFPGGPTCDFRGKNIPTMVRYNEGGGITASILTDIFKTLDVLEVFYDIRQKGMKPFVLLDGHQTRFDLNFLNYVNDEKHPWCFAIGVPYGTALWQVGDSVKQNGCFKMNLTKRKQEMMSERMRNMYGEIGITPYDIMPMVRKAWYKSFNKVHTNKKAYYDRGWMPFNRNLLLHEQIRATMSKDEVKAELESGMYPSVRMEKDKSISSCTKCTMSSEFNQKTTDTIAHEKIAAKGGTYAGSLLEQIASNNDLRAARQRNLQKSKQGDFRKDMFSSKHRKITASRWVLEGHSHHLGLDLVHELQTAVNIKIEEDKQKAKAQCQTLQKIHLDTAAVWLKHANQTNDVQKWSAIDITTVLKAYSVKTDKPIPMKKGELVALFDQWQHRTITNYNGKVEVDLSMNVDEEMEKETEEISSDENQTHAVLTPQVNQNSFDVTSDKVAI